MRVAIVQTPAELQACFDIRMDVFVREQAVPPEEELDAYDETATHFLMRDETEKPTATARLVNKGATAKIGRVAVVQKERGKGIGLTLMQAVLDEARRQGFEEAVLDSQTYAIPFYERLGFMAEGDEFDDAGIPHFTMRRQL